MRRLILAPIGLAFAAQAAAQDGGCPPAWRFDPEGGPEAVAPTAYACSMNPQYGRAELELTCGFLRYSPAVLDELASPPVGFSYLTDETPDRFDIALGTPSFGPSVRRFVYEEIDGFFSIATTYEGALFDALAEGETLTLQLVNHPQTAADTFPADGFADAYAQLLETCP